MNQICEKCIFFDAELTRRVWVGFVAFIGQARLEKNLLIAVIDFVRRLRNKQINPGFVRNYLLSFSKNSRKIFELLETES